MGAPSLRVAARRTPGRSRSQGVPRQHLRAVTQKNPAKMAARAVVVTTAALGAIRWQGVRRVPEEDQVSKVFLDGDRLFTTDGSTLPHWRREHLEGRPTRTSTSTARARTRESGGPPTSTCPSPGGLPRRSWRTPTGWDRPMYTGLPSAFTLRPTNRCFERPTTNSSRPAQPPRNPSI